jgi:hypothetical protein
MRVGMAMNELQYTRLTEYTYILGVVVSILW